MAITDPIIQPLVILSKGKTTRKIISLSDLMSLADGQNVCHRQNTSSYSYQQYIMSPYDHNDARMGNHPRNIAAFIYLIQDFNQAFDLMEYRFSGIANGSD